MSAITNKQEHFAQLVASGETYSDAYRKSYKVNPKCKIETVWVNSSQLMSDTKVSQRVKELQSNIQKKNEVTLEEVLKELATWLRFNVKTIFNEDGTMKQLHEMTDYESSCIASYEVVELFGNNGDGKAHIGNIRKVKIIDKQAVADKFLRVFGTYITNVKLDMQDLSHVKDLLDSIEK